MEKISFYVEPEIANCLREVAAKQKMSISSLLRDLIVPDDSIIEKRDMHRVLVEEKIKEVSRRKWIENL